MLHYVVLCRLFTRLYVQVIMGGGSSDVCCAMLCSRYLHQVIICGGSSEGNAKYTH